MIETELEREEKEKVIAKVTENEEKRMKWR